MLRREKKKKKFCLTVAQGLYFDSTSLVDNDTWTMAKDWQNEVLHRVTISSNTAYS